MGGGLHSKLLNSTTKPFQCKYVKIIWKQLTQVTQSCNCSVLFKVLKCQHNKKCVKIMFWRW